MISVVGSGYAKALVDVITTPGYQLDPKKALEELRAVGALINASQPLHNALLSPAVSPSRKARRDGAADRADGDVEGRSEFSFRGDRPSPRPRVSFDRRGIRPAAGRTARLRARRCIERICSDRYAASRTWRRSSRGSPARRRSSISKSIRR